VKNIVFFLLITAMCSDVVMAATSGSELFEKHCNQCHVKAGRPTAAPPIFAVIHHLKKEYPERNEFIKKVVDWVNNPNEKESLMPGAVRRFGLMPKLGYAEADVRSIAQYLYDGEIELPVWYKKHYKEKHGTEPK